MGKDELIVIVPAAGAGKRPARPDRQRSPTRRSTSADMPRPGTGTQCSHRVGSGTWRPPCAYFFYCNTSRAAGKGTFGTPVRKKTDGHRNVRLSVGFLTGRQLTA